MNTSNNRKSGLKKQSETKEFTNLGSLSKKYIRNIPEINSNFFENSLDAMMIGSQDGRIHAANSAACKMLGRSEKEICRLGRNGIVEQNKQLIEAVRKRRESGNFFGELTFIKKDGTSFTGEVSASVFTNSDGREFTTLIIRDISERKKSERKFFEFGERYRLLMENSGLGIGYYGLDGKILMFNQQAIINLGGKAEDYIGKNVTAVFGKEAGQIYIDRFKLVLASERPLKYEDYVNLDGKPSWYMSTHTRILDKNGNVDGIQVIADNITQKKIAENTILEKNANLTAIFENTKDMIASRDKKNCLVAFNTPFKEIVRKLYNAEAVTGLNTLKYLKKKDEIKWNGILNDVLNGIVYKSEFDWDFGNGDIRTYTISYQPIILNGEIIGTLETNRDITESKRADDKIREGYLYARSLIEASLDPLVTINIAGKITDVNVATEKITGLKRENLIGSDFADYFENPDKAKTGYKTVFSEGEVKDYPLTVLHKSGRRIDVLYNATLFKNEYGEVQGVFAAARDITKLKKTEEELRKSKKMLEKLNQHLLEVRENERNQIALNLHDDLGQKLTAINLDIAWLKSRIGVQSKSVREKFEEMSSMIKETVESIRETSSLLRPAILFDLGLVPAIKSQLGKFEKQTGIKCHFYFKPEEFDIEERVALILYRILQESLTNIARHSGASATEIDLVMLKNKIEMIIEDNGKGIAKDKVNSLESMGIAGMKERVKSANGKIIIRGENGAGTRIEVKIPLIKVKVDD